jgi:hypothetical protein
MSTLTLHIARDLRTPHETLGYLSLRERKWPSLELPWVPSPLSPAGMKGHSCVPPGEYRLVPHSTEAHPRVWALINPSLDIYHFDWDVPLARRGLARTVCLIHVANWASELEGCIAIGKERLKEANGTWMVSRSRDAINELRSCIGSSVDLRLIIQESSL